MTPERHRGRTVYDVDSRWWRMETHSRFNCAP